MTYHFDWGYVLTSLPKFQGAVLLTLQVFFCALLISTSGAIVMALLSRSGSKLIHGLLSAFSWLFRGLPELIVLLFAFLALPNLGVDISSFWAAVVGLAAISMAYEYEIFRGALTAIPPQQFEAARALGMRPMLMYRRVIGPQVMRVAVAPYLTFACTSLKRTSVTSSIAVLEIMGFTRRLIDVQQKPFELMLIAMVLYAALSSLIMILEILVRRHYSISQNHTAGA
jgi:polar amino acid transport system permease protein